MVSETKQNEKKNRIAIKNNRTCKKKDKSMRRDEQKSTQKNTFNGEWKLFKFKTNLSYFL